MPAGVSARSVSAGGAFSLAVGSDGMLYAWGNNYYGQLGIGRSGGYSTTPTPVVGLSESVRARAVFAGGRHGLALGANGHVYAWGDNGHGQLGDGTTAERTRPVTVTLPGGVRAAAVFAGDRFSLALGADGRLYAWGANADGELGDGAATDRATPGAVRLPRGVRVVAAAAGDYYGLAVGSRGALYAWGLNRFGQLGDGTRTTRRTPVAVALPEGVPAVAVAAWGDFSVALGTGGEMYAWGANGHGEVGDGTRAEQDSPVCVTLPLRGGT